MRAIDAYWYVVLSVIPLKINPHLPSCRGISSKADWEPALRAIDAYWYVVLSVIPLKINPHLPGVSNQSPQADWGDPSLSYRPEAAIPRQRWYLLANCSLAGTIQGRAHSCPH